MLQIIIPLLQWLWPPCDPGEGHLDSSVELEPKSPAKKSDLRLVPARRGGGRRWALPRQPRGSFVSPQESQQQTLDMSFAQPEKEAEDEQEECRPCFMKEAFPMFTLITSVLLVACWWLRRRSPKEKKLKRPYQERISAVKGKAMKTEPVYLVELDKECFPRGKVTEEGSNGNCFRYSPEDYGHALV